MSARSLNINDQTPLLHYKHKINFKRAQNFIIKTTGDQERSLCIPLDYGWAENASITLRVVVAVRGTLVIQHVALWPVVAVR